MKATQAAVNSFAMPRYDADHKTKAGQIKTEHIEFFDGKPGFGLRIRRNASKGTEHRSYVYQYKRGDFHYRINLGSAANLPFAAAKAAYEAHLGDKAKGNNPIQAIRDSKERDRASAIAERVGKASKTMSGHVADYLKWKQQSAKRRSFQETKRLLEKDYWKPLHDLPLKDIDRAMVASRLREIITINGSVTAGHARVALSSFFKWAMGEVLCEANPVIGTNKPKGAKSRKRVLEDAELAAIWNASPDNDFGRIVKLLMLTGCRRDEIGSLRWSEIDMAAKTLTLAVERLKNGNREGAEPHVVPLTDESLTILEGIHPRPKRDLVFGEGEGGYSGWSISKKRLDEASGVKDWRLHDLRRTASTRMNGEPCDIAPHIVEAVLNHVGAKKGVAGVYNREKYEGRKRAALETYANYIRTALASAATGNVRRFKAKVA